MKLTATLILLLLLVGACNTGEGDLSVNIGGNTIMDSKDVSGVTDGGLMAGETVPVVPVPEPTTQPESSTQVQAGS
jgi:predicted small secreted protein